MICVRNFEIFNRCDYFIEQWNDPMPPHNCERILDTNYKLKPHAQKFSSASTLRYKNLCRCSEDIDLLIEYLIIHDDLDFINAQLLAIQILHHLNFI